uniref:(California timema) hypothetical protein n=1 Tax=Timema californicum TaxID=61474 RepID=A0A7R9IXF7_TIMCA|nr:unnamed protein product [Timema californicum]
MEVVNNDDIMKVTCNGGHRLVSLVLGWILATMKIYCITAYVVHIGQGTTSVGAKRLVNEKMLLRQSIHLEHKKSTHLLRSASSTPTYYRLARCSVTDTYSSPTASLVLTDSSQLTSDSQHLGKLKQIIKGRCTMLIAGTNCFEPWKCPAISATIDLHLFQLPPTPTSSILELLSDTLPSLAPFVGFVENARPLIRLLHVSTLYGIILQPTRIQLEHHIQAVFHVLKKAKTSQSGMRWHPNRSDQMVVMVYVGK